MSHHSKGSRQAPIGAPLRHTRIFTEREHDPYRARRKPAAPTVCPSCHLVFSAGHWQQARWVWGLPPEHAREQLCPACRRIREHLPAGYVRLAGRFISDHPEEVLNTVKRCEARAKAEHPLQRIIAMEPNAGDVHITTTDIHLARRIGEALHRAYRGRLQFHYEAGQPLLRVTWTR